MIAFSDGDAVRVLRSRPMLDREASRGLVEALFPAHKLQSAQDSTLAEAYPSGHEVFAGVFPSLSIVSAVEFAPDRPSSFCKSYFEAKQSRFVYLHAMHSVVDWFAYAIWKDGALIRSLSVSPDSGVIEDLGQRRKFEDSFWAGERSVDDDSTGEREAYPLPFHPLELGEAALLDLFGFQLEGADGGLDPFEVPLCSFERRRKFLGVW